MGNHKPKKKEEKVPELPPSDSNSNDETDPDSVTDVEQMDTNSVEERISKRKLERSPSDGGNSGSKSDDRKRSKNVDSSVQQKIIFGSDSEVEEEGGSNLSSDVDVEKSSVKRRRRRKVSHKAPPVVSSSEVNSIIISKMKSIGDSLRSFLLDEKNKVSKQACNEILSSVSSYEQLVGELLCENSVLKGRLEERKSMLDSMSSLSSHVTRVSGGGGNFHVSAPGASSRGVVSSTPVSSTPAAFFKPSYSLIVKSKSEESNDVIKERLLNGVKASKGVRVTSIFPAKSGGIIVRTAGENDREALKNSKHLKKAGFEVVEPSPPSPRLIVFDVNSKVTSENFLSELYSRNLSGLFESEDFGKNVKVIRRQDGKGEGLSNVIIEVSTLVRDFLLNEGRVFINWSSYRVKDYIRVNRCFKIAGFGHESWACNTGVLCYKCGKAGHLAAACKDESDCGNCRRRNLDSRHSALSSSCPEYGWRLVQQRSRFYKNS